MAKRFSKINIEISNICNLHCSFCPEIDREKKMMSVDLFARIISQVAPLTDQVCLHLMGDPLIHPKLADFIDICHQHQVPIFFVTNGVLLRDNNATLLLHPAFRQVNFSLHSFHDNYPDRDPENYLQKIFSYTEAALAQRPDLYINYRLWNLSDPRGSSQQNRLILQKVAEKFHMELPTAIDVRRRKSIPIRGRLYFHFDTEFTWPGLELPILGTSGTCYGLQSHFGILADGTVVPCCLDQEGAIALGHVDQQSVEEILSSPRAQSILEGFRRNQLREDLCQRCQYVERFQSAARHP